MEKITSQMAMLPAVVLVGSTKLDDVDKLESTLDMGTNSSHAYLRRSSERMDHLGNKALFCFLRKGKMGAALKSTRLLNYAIEIKRIFLGKEATP